MLYLLHALFSIGLIFLVLSMIHGGYARHKDDR
jgi:hypothetical protein